MSVNSGLTEEQDMKVDQELQWFRFAKDLSKVLETLRTPGVYRDQSVTSTWTLQINIKYQIIKRHKAENYCEYHIVNKLIGIFKVTPLIFFLFNMGKE